MAVNVTLEKATMAHAAELAAVMRAADVLELTATGDTPMSALERGVGASEICCAIRFDGEIGVVFGLVRTNQDNALAYRPDNVWFLTGDAVNRHPRAFLRTMKSLMQQLLSISPALYNWVDERYVGAVWLLRQLGVELSEPVAFGINGELFRLGIRRR